jgi:hypothetical protein
VRAHDPGAGTNVVVETFLRFKGLERPAIIITDVSLAIDKPDYKKRMYIALTRALSTARIVDTRNSISCDPFLTNHSPCDFLRTGSASWCPTAGVKEPRAV